MTDLQQQILDVLESIPDGPLDNWVAWAQVAEALGRPSTPGRAVAQATQPLPFGHWEQVRNVEGSTSMTRRPLAVTGHLAGATELHLVGDIGRVWPRRRVRELSPRCIDGDTVGEGRVDATMPV